MGLYTRNKKSTLKSLPKSTVKNISKNISKRTQKFVKKNNRNNKEKRKKDYNFKNEKIKTLLDEKEFKVEIKDEKTRLYTYENKNFKVEKIKSLFDLEQLLVKKGLSIYVNFEEKIIVKNSWDDLSLFKVESQQLFGDMLDYIEEFLQD